MKNILVLLFAIVLAACSNSVKTEPVKEEPVVSGVSEIQTELQNYIDVTLKSAGESESQALSAYDSVVGENYSNDEETYNVLMNEVIPEYKAYIQELESASNELNNEEIRNVNEKFIEAANLQYSAFVRFGSALENGDSSGVLEVNERLDKARKIMRDANYNLRQLCEKHGVVSLTIPAGFE